jgi:hypothetical protein
MGRWSGGLRRALFWLAVGAGAACTSKGHGPQGDAGAGAAAGVGGGAAAGVGGGAAAGVGGAAGAGGAPGQAGGAGGNGGGIVTQGLTPVGDGQIVYDANQNVYWLADANLAGDAALRAALGVAGINPNGTMDYPTAQRWVAALNGFDGGNGYLGHNDWQLPVTPMTDESCSVLHGPSGNSFGVSCMRSALGNLYGTGLARVYPQSVLPGFTGTAGAVTGLRPSLYWASDPGSSPDAAAGANGEPTFSFVTGLSGMNTTTYNYFYVLPMVAGAIGPAAPTGAGVVPYPAGSSAAGLAVYDTQTQTTWAMNADLAAASDFGVTGVTTVPGPGATSLTVPLIDASGAMLFGTVSPWLAAVNGAGYAGSNGWSLPTVKQLKALAADLQLATGDDRLTSSASVGPFRNLQPFFYWACERAQGGSSQSLCNGADAAGQDGGTPLEFSFNFDSGFQGTDLEGKQFYVMVYYPAP